MKNNEVSTPESMNVQPPIVPESNDVPQTPAVPESTDMTQTPVMPVTSIPEETVTPMQAMNFTATPVENTVQSVPPVNSGDTPNKFTNLTEKLKSFGVGPIVTIAVVAVILIGGIILSVASSTPKSVFKKAINTIYKGANVAIEGYETYLEEYDITENAFLVNGNLTFESNVEEYKENNLSKINIGFNAGVDYKNEILSLGGSLKGDKETVKLNAQLQKNEMYVTSSLFKEVLKIDSNMLSELGVNVDFENLKEEIKEIQKEYNTDPETYDYLVTTFKDTLIKSINSEYMEKEKDEIDVLDKEVSVTKYSYVFDEDAVQDLITNLAEKLLEDEEFAKTLADAFGVKKSDVKELLKEMKKEAKDIEFDGEVALNIYTRGLFNSYAGIGFELEGKEYFSLYTDGKNLEMTIDDHAGGEYGTKIVMTIEKDGKGYKGVVKENKDKLLEIEIKELSEEVFDSEFVVYDDGEKQGTIKVYIKVQLNKDSFVTNYEVRITEEETKEYMGYKGDYTIEFKDSVEKMNIKDSIDFEELDIEKLEEEVDKISENDEALGSIVEDAVNSIKKDMLDLNYKGMAEIEANEVANILSKDKPTVLYIGNTYYSSYSEEQKYELLKSLTDLQEELGFYSYYLDEYLVTSEVEGLFKDIQYICSSSTPTIDYEESESAPQIPPTSCEGYPAIYLIKDGKVQKAFKQSVTYNDLKSALTEIGIE